MPIMVENINAQTITPANGRNPRQLYEHQEEAVKKLDAMDKKGEFRTLLVLPTGGGKTLTAAHWLLRNAVDKGKKILWIAIDNQELCSFPGKLCNGRFQIFYPGSTAA